jgi:hypothetical protein
MQATQAPWNSWSLDEEFFGSLSRWTLERPQDTLTQVLDKVSDALETTKSVRAVIPDSPFPARSLVEALLSLLKLGIVRIMQSVPDHRRS